MAAQNSEPFKSGGRLVIGVEIVDAKGLPLGELDEVDVVNRLLIENKSAIGLNTVHPLTGMLVQTPTEWANKQIFAKTVTRIENLKAAHRTRPTKGGSANVPSLEEIRKIRALTFWVEADDLDVQAAVGVELFNLSAAYPDWTFSAEYGRAPLREG